MFNIFYTNPEQQGFSAGSNLMSKPVCPFDIATKESHEWEHGFEEGRDYMRLKHSLFSKQSDVKLGEKNEPQT